MDQTAPHSRAPEDRLVFWALALTWPVYLLGGLYVLGPVLGVGLCGLAFMRWYVSGGVQPRGGLRPVPAGVWVWIVGMMLMLVALEVGHFNQRLGLGQTIKSTIGWAKGWALLAMFPLVGACLNVRLDTIIKASRYVAVGTLLVTPIMLMAPNIGLPEVLFVSPLKLVGGPGPEFFAIQLYSIEPTDGSTRLRYFTPWSPAAGLIGNLYLILALHDRSRLWKLVGIAAALAMIVLSKSRLALAAVVLIWPLVLMLSHARKPSLWLLAAIAVFLMTPFAQGLIDILDGTMNSVKSMRADSTRVREALGDIALQRWWTEAPVWGHGVVERGPHFVEFMPIGSHHTWYGLLFVKGAVGALALLVPLLWSLIEFGFLSVVRSKSGQIAFAVTAILLFYSIGENLEILTYLMWPGLLVMGIAMSEGRRLSATQN